MTNFCLGTFAIYINNDAFSSQPLSAFRLTSPRIWSYAWGNYSGVLRHNVGRLLFARMQKPLDIAPQIPIAINRCLEFVLRFEADPTDDRRKEIVRLLCDSVAESFDPRPCFLHEALQWGCPLPGKGTEQERNKADSLAAAVVMSNHAAITASIQNGASFWLNSNIFAWPLTISTAHTRDRATTTYLLEHMPRPGRTDKTQLAQMYTMFSEVIEHLLDRNEMSTAHSLLDWIVKNVSPPDKDTFNASKRSPTADNSYASLLTVYSPTYLYPQQGSRRC